MSDIRGITITVIWETFSENRDETVGNMSQLKKVTRPHGTFTYRSREKNRFDLFTTLLHMGWREAFVTVGKVEEEEEKKEKKDVIQFDITRDNIITSEELDAFGYLYTIKGEASIKRKKTVDVTKAEALEPYFGDTSFGANHDLVRRLIAQGKDATPNIFNREENKSLYKVTFTIDCTRLGRDEWIVDWEFLPKLEFIKQVYGRDLMDILERWFKGDYKAIIDAYKSSLPIASHIEQKVKEILTELKDSKKGWKWGKFKGEFEKKDITSINDPLSLSSSDIESWVEKLINSIPQKPDKDDNIGKFLKQEFESFQSFAKHTIIDTIMGSGTEIKVEKSGDIITYSLIGSSSSTPSGSSGSGREIGIIKIEEIYEKVKITFEVSEKEKKQRIKNILEAIKNGFANGRETLIPVFIVACGLKVPSPIFHPLIEIVHIGSNIHQVIGIEEALGNLWIHPDTKVFIYQTQKARCHPNLLNDSKVTTNWKEFLENLGLS